MKAYVDHDLCIGCGVCPSVCPEVFEMGDDGLSHVIVDTVPEDAEDNAKDAEESCPVDAIKTSIWIVISNKSVTVLSTLYDNLLYNES